MRRDARLTIDACARLCGVTVSTVQRWIAANRAPAAVARLLSLYAGSMAALPGCEAWQGWRVVAGSLWSPEGTEFTPGDLRALHWYRQRDDFKTRRDGARGVVVQFPITKRENVKCCD